MPRQAPRRAAGMVILPVQRADPKVLLDFLALKLSLTRRTAKAVIDGRNVWVNRECAWIARFAIGTGDVVEIPERVVRAAVRQGSCGPSAAGERQRRHIRVIWQDARYLVCDKPAGMLSGGGPGSVESVLREQEDLAWLEAVHRLDRDTTGCLLFAKDAEAREAAVAAFRTRSVAKTYHAIVAGRFPFAHQTIAAPLDGKPAVSRVAREAATECASFLRVRIETGRTNQIRRHLASIRFPVVGDRVFGLQRARDPRLMQVPRQMLHASTLVLPDPFSPHGEISAHSPLPADFRSALSLFGMGRR